MSEERAADVERRLRHLERELAELAERIAEQVNRSEAVALEEADLRREWVEFERCLPGCDGGWHLAKCRPANPEPRSSPGVSRAESNRTLPV